MDIVLEGIDKNYGSLSVLKHFSCTFREGSITAIMAPSGKGKTTLLKLLLGLEMPDAGKVSGVPERCAVLFQEDRLFPDMTVAGNLRAVLGNRISYRQLLESLGIWDCRDQKVSSLSGGQARRAALARALLFPGELLILDEPFNGLDAQARLQAAECIRQYRKGRTLIFVTHRTEDADLLQAQKILAI